MLKLVAVISALASLLASAAAGANEAELRKLLAQRFPNDAVESVVPAPMPGLYEVYANGEIFYTDAKLTYIITGRILEPKTFNDLTGERLSKLRAIRFDELPLDAAFRMVRGNGSRRIAYFADPNCGYCRQFERELMALNDVTVHVFLYPILGDDSVVKARSVWCSSDRVKTWQNWMLNEATPPSASCATPIDRIVAFGRKQRITGTPTLILADGTRVPGAIPSDRLQKLVAAAGK